MNLHEAIVRALKGMNTVEIKALAERTGLHWSGIYKVARGATDPKWSTLHALQRAFGLPNPQISTTLRTRLYGKPKKALRVRSVGRAARRA